MDSMYDQVLGICEKYLSKDSQKFLDRQIKSHLKKEPGEIDAKDTVELAKWSLVSGGLLVGKTRAEQMANEIVALVSAR